MKKVLIFSAIVIFALTACKKEDVGDVNNAQQTQSKRIEALILNFKDKLENNLKDGTTYAADSAVWYVEALLNYTNGNASTPCLDPIIDTAERNINGTGANGFTLQQLNDVYVAIEDDVLANQPENTNIFAIDLYTYPAGNLTVFAARTAYSSVANINYKSVSDTAGYWYWGAQKGMCGADSGSYVGMDATDILEGLINTISCDYWTSLETETAWPNSYIDPNFPFTDQYLYPTRLFSAGDACIPVLNFCLSPDHIDYYNSDDGIHYAIDDLRPQGKRFMYCVLSASAADCYAVHVGLFTYGVPN